MNDKPDNKMPEFVLPFIIDEPDFKAYLEITVNAHCLEDAKLAFEMKAHDHFWFNFDYNRFGKELSKTERLKALTEHMSKLFIKKEGR